MVLNAYTPIPLHLTKTLIFPSHAYVLKVKVGCVEQTELTQRRYSWVGRYSTNPKLISNS